MSGHHPPLTCAEFKAVLKALGFSPRAKRSGTSHEDWVATINGRFRKVTVDCPKAPFSQDLITSMAHQAGVTKKRIYDIHFGRENPNSGAPTSSPPLAADHRRALAVIASAGHSGITEEMLIMRGFKTEQIEDMTRASWVTIERVDADGHQTETKRVRITDAGRKAIEDP